MAMRSHLSFSTPRSHPPTHRCSLTQLPVSQQPLHGGPHNFSHPSPHAPLSPFPPNPPPKPSAPAPSLSSYLPAREAPQGGRGKAEQPGPGSCGAWGWRHPDSAPRSAAGPPRRTPAAGAHYLAACLPPPISSTRSLWLSIPQVPAEAHCAGADLTSRIWPFPALPCRTRTRTALTPRPPARGHCARAHSPTQDPVKCLDFLLRMRLLLPIQLSRMRARPRPACFALP